MPDRLIEKSIWLEMEYLREALHSDDRPSAKLSANALAEKLNAIGKESPIWLQLNNGRMHEIRAAKMHMRPEQQALLLRAILSLKKISPIPQISEDEIEALFASKLPTRFIETRTPFEGEPLAEEMDFLFGPWRFFYHSPAGRTTSKPEFRGIAVVLRKSGSTSRFSECAMFSKNNNWRGRAFINKHNLYMMCSNLNETEAAFFITNRPTREERKVVGIAINLDRKQNRGIRPAVACVFFGMKCASATDSDAAFLQEAASRGKLSAADEARIRASFCVTYRTMQTLEKVFPELCSYVKKHSINNRKGLPSQWLHVDWNEAH
jgi:hypothetical protein